MKQKKSTKKVWEAYFVLWGTSLRIQIRFFHPNAGFWEINIRKGGVRKKRLRRKSNSYGREIGYPEQVFFLRVLKSVK